MNLTSVILAQKSGHDSTWLTRITAYQGFFDFGLQILIPVIDAPLRGTEDVPVEVEGAKRSPVEGFTECGFGMGKDGSDVVGRCACRSLLPVFDDSVLDTEVETFVGFGGSEGCSEDSGADFPS